MFNSGFILFCMLFSKFPFKTNNLNNYTLQPILENDPIEFWERMIEVGIDVDEVSDDCKDLIFSLLSSNPDSRPTVF